MLQAELLEIRHRAGRPEPRHLPGAARPLAHVGQVGEIFEHGKVDGFRRRAQARLVRALLQRLDQRVEIVHRQVRLAPEDLAHRLETMLLDPLDFLRRKGRRAVRCADVAERAILLVPPRAPGDLRHLGDGQAARALPVIFTQRGEGDMLDIQIEPHADRIRRDQIIDLARLEHRDLGIARGRAERPHHHRRAAAMPTQRLGHAIDLLHREGDDGRALGQARELGAARIAQGGEARPRDDLRLGQERAHQRRHAGRAEQHRLLAAARIQHTVGEDMAPLGVGGELDLVQRNEGEVLERAEAAARRHRLGGGHHIAGVGRDDALLAGEQRHLIRALDARHALVHLPRQQPQRKAHEAARMTAHALDRQMRLAGVGRPEHGLLRSGSVPRHNPGRHGGPGRLGQGQCAPARKFPRACRIRSALSHVSPQARRGASSVCLTLTLSLHKPPREGRHRGSAMQMAFRGRFTRCFKRLN